MFTVKITDKDGHTVKECASYRFRKNSHGQTDAPDTDSLDLYDAAGNVEWVRITGTTYVMNSAGKTIDTFHAAPTSTARIGSSGVVGVLPPRD